MGMLSKRLSDFNKNIDRTKQYSISEAIMLLKKMATAEFIESVDVAFNLNIDPRKPDQNVRGVAVLPHGTGRSIRVAAFTQGMNAEAALSAGAELVGMEDLVHKIQEGSVKFDIVIASPDAMQIVSQLGPILGPRGLMPNSKFGTVSKNIAEAIKNIKSGQIRYRNDKNGIVHATIGRVNFEDNKLKENFEALFFALKKTRPSFIKGIYFKKITLSSTMGRGIMVDQTDFQV